MGRKFTKLKQKVVALSIVAVLLTFGLSACGVNTAAGGKGNEARGSAVSGAAVTESISGSAVSEASGKDEGRTSFSEKALGNLNSSDSEWIENVLRQYTKDGKETGEFYHIDKETYPVYVDKKCVILVSEKGRFVRYDRESGELTEKYPFGKGKIKCYICPVDTETELQELYVEVKIYKAKGDSEDSTDLYAYNLKERKWKRIISGKKITTGYLSFRTMSINSAGDKVLFQLLDGDECDDYERIYLRDVTNDTMTELVTNDMCEKLIEKDKIFDDHALIMCEIECMPEGNGYSGERQYFNALVEADSDEKRESAYAIFSTGFEKGDLRYEKQLTEAMWETGIYKYVRNPEDYFMSYRVNLAFCLDVRGDEAVFRFETKERRGLKTAVYNMATGNVRNIVESDGKWYERYEPADAMLYEDMPNLQDDWYEEFDDDEAVYED